MICKSALIITEVIETEVKYMIKKFVQNIIKDYNLMFYYLEEYL